MSLGVSLNKKWLAEIFRKPLILWSGREDFNLRPPVPHAATNIHIINHLDHYPPPQNSIYLRRFIGVFILVVKTPTPLEVMSIWGEGNRGPVFQFASKKVGLEAS